MQHSCLLRSAEEQSSLPGPLPRVSPPGVGHHHHLHREEHPLQGTDARATVHTHGCWLVGKLINKQLRQIIPPRPGDLNNLVENHETLVCSYS